MKVKEEPNDIETHQTSKEIVRKAEEEEFTNKRLIQTVSIGFLNDQTSSTKSSDANRITKTNLPNNPRNKKSKLVYRLKTFLYHFYSDSISF